MSTAVVEEAVDVGAQVIERAASMPTERLEAEIKTLAGHLAAALCRWLLMVAEFDRREGWAAWECRSCSHWLSWHCSMSLRTAQEHLRVAHALGELPLVRAGFSTGELSYSQVRAITRAADCPMAEEFLVNFARYATAPMLEKMVAGYRRTGRLDDEGAEARHDQRSFEWWFDDDGMVCFKGRLAPEEGQIVIAAIQAATVPAAKRSVERPVDDQGVPLPQPGDDPKVARQADALVAICDRALTGGAENLSTGGEPAERTRGLVSEPTSTVVVLVDDDVLCTDADGTCRLDGGPNLSPETARRLGCDAAKYTIALGPDGTPRLVGKATKTVSRQLRRELGIRDDGSCQFPGCDLLGHLHAHHIIHREHDGPNVLDNLIALCAFHHRLVHEGGYRVELLMGQVIVHRPGRADLSHIPNGPASGPDVQLRNLAEGLDIDQDTTVSLWDGTRLSYDDLSWTVAALNHNRDLIASAQATTEPTG